MSETGACIIINRPLPIEASATMEIDSIRQDRLLKEEVRVVWCAERLESVKELVGYLTGVSFQTKSPEGVRALLSSGIFQPIP